MFLDVFSIDPRLVLPMMMSIASLDGCVAVVNLEPVSACSCFVCMVPWPFCMTSCCHLRMVQDGNIWNFLASQLHWIFWNSSSIHHCMCPSLDIWLGKRGGRLFFSDYFQSLTSFNSINAVNGTIAPNVGYPVNYFQVYSKWHRHQLSHSQLLCWGVQKTHPCK